MFFVKKSENLVCDRDGVVAAAQLELDAWGTPYRWVGRCTVREICDTSGFFDYAILAELEAEPEAFMPIIAALAKRYGDIFVLA